MQSTDVVHVNGITQLKTRVFLLTEKARAKDPAYLKLLNAGLAWLDRAGPLFANQTIKPGSLSNAVIADLVDGITSDTPELDAVFRALAAYLRVVPAPAPAPGHARAPSLIGCSNVATLDALEAEVILAAGMRLVQAEAIPFSAEKDGRGVSAFSIERLVRIAEVVRRYADSVLLITLVNWNGASQRMQDTAWFQDRLAEIIARVGPTQVWLEAVSEPDEGGKAEEWQRLAARMWPGTLAGNGPGGRGTPIVGSIVDWHYCDYADLLANIGMNRLHSTDCTPTLASNLSESQVREVTRAAIRAQSILMLYDTDNAPRTSGNVIRWMSEEIAASAPGPVPPPSQAPMLSSPNLLAADLSPWLPGTPGTRVNPDFEARLRSYLQAHPDASLTIADLAEVPDAMGRAGWQGRDNAKWYCLSRSAAGWAWAVNPSDGDSVYFDGLREETRTFWLNYVDLVARVMRDYPRCSAFVVVNDAVDRCGKLLQETTIDRVPPELRGRLVSGHVLTD